MQSIPRTSTRSRRVAWVLLAAIALLAPSCKLFSTVVGAPGKVFNPSSSDGKRQHPARVQTAVMRFADGYNVQVVQATREFAELAGTPEAKVQSLSWAIAQTTASLAIACGSNPNANLLDMLVLVKLGRILHEEHWTKVWGEADQPMVDAYRKLEEDLDLTARRTLTLAELEEVNEAVREWRDANPDMAFTGFVRLPGFRSLLETRRAQAREESRSDPFAKLAELVSLDPLAGLEPTKREVEQTRLFGERTLFYAQRAPLIFAMQAELLGLKLAAIPTVRTAVEATDRISHSAESLAETAAAFPETFERVEGPARELLGEARATVDAIDQGSASLEKAIVSFDTLMERFERDPAEKRTDEPRGRPFDVTEYGAAAASIGEAAGDLDQLIASVERTEPRIEGLADRILNRALLYGLVLIAATAIAVIAVRRISGRRAPSPEPKRESPPQRPSRFFPHEAR